MKDVINAQNHTIQIMHEMLNWKSAVTYRADGKCSRLVMLA